MEILLFLVIFVPLSLLIATKAADRSDRQFLLFAVVCAWVTLGPLVVMVNVWIPFSGGGDDWSYFRLTESPINNWSEVVDLTRFVGMMEQPGYPLLLSIVNVLVGSDLLVYKLLNLFFLILLALTWYRIGVLLESPSFARRMMMVILLLAPLWYYMFFLLKDMSITLLQSLFLLSAVEIWWGGRFKPVVGSLVSTFLLLLFRSPLIAQNGFVLLGSLAFKAFGHGWHKDRVLPLLVALIPLLFFLPLATNPEVLASFGITAEQKVLGSQVMFDDASFRQETSEMSRVLFPLLYLFSETAGLNPQAWIQLDSAWLRGVLALPWILLVVPFFILGLRWLLRAPPDMRPASGLVGRLRQSRLMATPWSAVLLFIASSVAISWTVGDSTRWRIPDMPMIAAVAVAGWTYAGSATRQHLLVGWVGGISVLFSLYYLLRG